MSAMTDFFANKRGWKPLQGTFTECWGNGCMCVETRVDQHRQVAYRGSLLGAQGPIVKGWDRATIAEAYGDALDFGKRYTGGAP